MIGKVNIPANTTPPFTITTDKERYLGLYFSSEGLKNTIPDIIKSIKKSLHSWKQN
eukprot:gene10894-13348_t